MFKEKLNKLIRKKKSLVCVGLDSDLARIPKFLWQEEDPLLTFNQEIIQATQDLAIAYKLNLAFYETLGVEGWKLLEKTVSLIPSPILKIADAKRSDIGNSALKYAETFFSTYDFDAVTVSPYMGKDAVTPFLDFVNRGIFVLCLTSNTGSQDFQYLSMDSEPLYLKVAKQIVAWNIDYGNAGLVVGATHPEDLSSIREIAPEMPFLLPGVGAQGGNLRMAVHFGTDVKGENALISASRSLIYASAERDFAKAARIATMGLKEQINQFRSVKE